MRTKLASLATFLAVTFVITLSGGRTTVRSELRVSGASSNPSTIAVFPFLIHSTYTKQVPPDNLEKVGSLWFYYFFGAHEFRLSTEQMPKPRPLPGPLPAALKPQKPGG